MMARRPKTRTGLEWPTSFGMHGVIIVNEKDTFVRSDDDRGFLYPEFGQCSRFVGTCRIPVCLEMDTDSPASFGMAEIRLTMPTGKTFSILIPLDEIRHASDGDMCVGGTFRVNKRSTILCEGHTEKSRAGTPHWTFVLDTVVVYNPHASV